jgi:TFIIF-interacting CTD phosphatase-like protein
MAEETTKRGTPLSESVALLNSTKLHAESVRTSRELMNAQEAAEFLRIPYSEFRRLAPYLPRHPVTERRYVYHRKELLEWVLTR